MKNHKGFTLLELLVVVLIIAILAAIAMPQYKMAVGKAKFSTLKNITKSITESAQRYYLIHNIYPRHVADLDIDLDIVSKSETSSSGLSFILSSGISCSIWNETSQNYVACYRKIFGKTVAFYVNRDKGIPAICIAFSTDENDDANRLCYKETGKSGRLTNGAYYNYLY